MEKQGLPAIDEILELLKNGEWHSLEEVTDKTQLQGSKVKLITSFLAEYEFLETNKKEKKIKLSPGLLLFLKKIENIETEETQTEEHMYSHLRS